MDWLPSIFSWAILAALIWLAGLLCAFSALMNTRSERGAIAWCISLLSMPFITVPFYIVFGRRKFSGYRASISKAISQHRELVVSARDSFAPFTIPPDEMQSPLCAALAAINSWKFSKGNHFQLLIDGTATFDAIISSIQNAKAYILFQFYIIRDDGIGQRIKRELIAKANQGVRIYFLYDEIGCSALPNSFLDDLREHGAEIKAFGTTRGRANRFQINFRNHRKIVVTDGVTAFVGGHNVGDEYLGKSPRFGPWRDSHVRIQGPAVMECQAVFLMDWFWATGEIPEVDTVPKTAPQGGHPAMIMPSGPTQDSEICQLAFQALLANAHSRLWIATPYLVPDEATLVALHFAAKRGVDVRILIPDKSDHLLAFLAAFSFFEELENFHVAVHRYNPGFLHQKVVLVDDQIAGVGTVNLDYRSFFLNFEITAFSTDPDFIRSVADMLESDFSNSTRATAADYYSRNLPFRVGVRIARLFSPIL